MPAGTRIVWLILCWGLVVIPLAAAAVAAPQPNVVFIVSDDHHWRDYGFMGHAQLRTPHLDRLARESLVFRRGYVPSSLCCPSLASIITGRYPHEHRIIGNDPPTPPDLKRSSPEWQAAFNAGRERMNDHLAEWPTLPQLLGRHGYRSLQTGKWWQGHFSRGGFTDGMTKGSRHGDAGLAIGRTTMQPIYDFMARCREESRPFFVWYAPMLPHTPHDPPAELVEHYRTKTDSIHVARYWASVERFDRTVGELLDHLDHAGLAADTLVVYVTDNGWIQNPKAEDFASRSKLSPDDGGLRTPIMLRRPGTIRPRESTGLASALDLVPTVLTACGIEPPAGLPGIDLLDEAAVAARKEIFGECYTHTLVDLDDPARSLLWRWIVRQDAVGGPMWKLVVPADGPARPLAGEDVSYLDPETRRRYNRDQIELFDLANDPDEQHDRAADEPGVVHELEAAVDAWWRPTPAGGDARAADWPAWRGPHGDGAAAGGGLVASWSPEDNVVWRVRLPGLGASTPVVAEDRIVVTCTIDGRNAAVCLDRTGREQWRRLLGAERPGKHKKATGANPSPVTDGTHVWVYFKSGELACLDLETGAERWRTNLQTRFGADTLWWDIGTSPVLTRSAVVLAVVQTGPSYLVAFERKTGKLVWKHDRELPAPEESTQSYATPLVLEGQAGLGEPAELLVVLGADHVTAHDAADGHELWRVGGLNPTQHRMYRAIASPVAAGTLVVAPYARGGSLTAIRRGGTGDVTATHVAWSRDDVGADVPTPAFAAGRLVVCGDKGAVSCLDPVTGKTLARHALAANRHTYSSSPVIAGDRLILTREDGHATLLAWPPPDDPAAEWREAGAGDVGEMTVANPVCIDGRILLRTHDSLWCIGAE